MPKPRPLRRGKFVIHPEQDGGYAHFQNASAHPFDPQGGVGALNAWWLADAAMLAYWDGPAGCEKLKKAGLQAQFIAEEGVECYVASTDRFAIVAFRGTEPDQWRDILDDALFIQAPWGGAGMPVNSGRVHVGFKQAFERVWDVLKPRLDALPGSPPVWFTGHSLGAALATVAAAAYPRAHALCTFGSPRVGDRVFCAQLDEHLGHRVARYVFEADVVAHVPPEAGIKLGFPPVPYGYTHVGELRLIDRETGAIQVTKDGDWIHYLAKVFGSGLQVLQSIHLMQSMPLFEPPANILDHMPRGYAIDIWNHYEATRS